MKFVKTIISKFYSIYKIKEPKKVLGRWNLDYCEKKMNTKIDLANEDHCGPCGNDKLTTSFIDKLNTKYTKK